MKEYKGLKIPEVNEESPTIESIQLDYCSRSVCADDDSIYCDECLYNITNLPQFTEWYSQNK